MQRLGSLGQYFLKIGLSAAYLAVANLLLGIFEDLLDVAKLFLISDQGELPVFLLLGSTVVVFLSQRT